jgi:hypothetical protein
MVLFQFIWRTYIKIPSNTLRKRKTLLKKEKRFKEKEIKKAGQQELPARGC